METKTKKKYGILVASIILILAAGLLLGVTQKHSADYRKAVSLEENGQFGQAYTLYHKAGRYKDSPQRMEALLTRHPEAALAGAKPGDLVSFGRYEQDGNEGNGPEPVQWYVLDQVDGRSLLLSRTCLACMGYHSSDDDITWEECALRAWLNGAFLNQAFSKQEQGVIALTKNENPDEDRHGTRGGRDTEDRVFLLSEMEAQVYFSSEESRDLMGAAESSQLAIDQGIFQAEPNDLNVRTSPWWLRSPGTYQNSAVFVENDGTTNSNGAIAGNNCYCGVRPAVWIETEQGLKALSDS